MPCLNESCLHHYRSHINATRADSHCKESGCECVAYMKPPFTPRVSHPASARPLMSNALSRPIGLSPNRGRGNSGSYRARTSREKDPTTVIGRRWEKVRHFLKLSKPEMARKVGVSAITYRAWTNTGLGFTWPKMVYQRRLAELEGMVGILKGAADV